MNAKGVDITRTKMFDTNIIWAYTNSIANNQAMERMR